jgi:hypothetical protein
MTQYIWRIKTRLPERYMTPCQVIARGRMNSCLVEFEDGYRVVTSCNYFRLRSVGESKTAITDRF